MANPMADDASLELSADTLLGGRVTLLQPVRRVRFRRIRFPSDPVPTDPVPVGSGSHGSGSRVSKVN